MTIDIIFYGFLPNLFIKKKFKQYFQSIQHIERNNVFVDFQKNNTYHIKKNSIHISVASDEFQNIKNISVCLNYIFKDTLVGIKTTDAIYEIIRQENQLNLLRI